MKKQKAKQTVSDVIKGEISRLNSKFKIKVDKSQRQENGTIRILCFLGMPIFLFLLARYEKIFVGNFAASLLFR